jgi:hypothetical protein
LKYLDHQPDDPGVDFIAMVYIGLQCPRPKKQFHEIQDSPFYSADGGKHLQRYAVLFAAWFVSGRKMDHLVAFQRQ